MNMIIDISVLLLLIVSVYSLSISSSSYTIDSVHYGLSGSEPASSSYSMRSTTTYQQAGTDNASSTTYEGNIGWFSASSSSSSGNVSNKVYIYNGSEWVDYSSANDIDFRCSNPFPSYCEPTNQDNTTSQPIFTNVNTLNTSHSQAIKTNASWATASLLCGKDVNPAYATNLTTNWTTYATDTLLKDENNTLYCWFYIESVPTNFTRDFEISLKME